ncbi:MAG: hypothetical protein HOK21_22820 [Rhodospirillaceae bacterium]|nr:hypothetical protein [Rhodospirillaceae bacterium]MBT5081487.1 hypothetical protein [Rhodospirillaceae bacterium]MBT5526929.1 hypothetical protein [Rhodospirillaceae bacterium]MBT5881825.1 hypothetical protein [Rhodospirillaceae bacterium]MBT6587530.1 hypothetical protein [Rhodospirillaceae bacterium]
MIFELLFSTKICFSSPVPNGITLAILISATQYSQMHAPPIIPSVFLPEQCSGQQLWRALIAIALVAFSVRLAAVLAGPWAVGDAEVYANVAGNILHNFCVSMDHWAAASCTPHWGGNQLPGYPTFIALSWFAFGDSVTAPLLFQSVLFTLSICYFCWALGFYGAPPVSIWCVGLMLAFSPSLAGWSRALMTEALSSAVALWILAEIVRSLAENRFRTWPIAIASLIGFFIRYDFVLIALPIALCALALHGAWGALRKGIAIALIVAVPFGVWTTRSVIQGLPATPPFGLSPQGHQLPQGALAWIGTWLSHQYQLGISVWPLATETYANIAPPDEAYADDEERKRVAFLLTHLRQIKRGEPVPGQIDDAFAALASERIHANPLWHYGFLPLRRMAIMWVNPAASMGWPGMLGSVERADIRQIIGRSGFLFGGIEAAVKYPAATLSKGLTAGWRLASIVLALFVLCLSFRESFRPYRLIIWICLLFVATRSIAFSQTLLLETRYLTPALAWSDVAGGIGLGWLLWHLGQYRRRLKGIT